MRILIVDDVPEIRKLLKTRLEMAAPHFTVETAGNGCECLDRVADKKVDCILSDYKMPKMYGLELLTALRERGDYTPFILITGQETGGFEGAACDAGAEGLFRKEMSGPWFAEVAATIEEAVLNRRSRQPSVSPLIWRSGGKRPRPGQAGTGA